MEDVDAELAQLGADRLAEAAEGELARAVLGRLRHAAPGEDRTDVGDARRNELAWSGRRGVPPEKVADRIVHGIERRQNEVAILWEDWWIVKGARAVPWLFDWALKRHG